MSLLALIAGIPLGAYRRRPERPTFEQWRVRVIPSSHHSKAKLDGIWTRVMRSAEAAAADGVHLILAHYRDDERPKFEDEASKSFRVVWLSRGIAQSYGAKAFDEAIGKALSFEDDWRRSLRPSIDSPLLLPETAFSAEMGVADMWRRAMRVREDRDSIAAVANMIGRFRERHRRSEKWRDVENLTFARGPSHGGQHLPGWRRMKLTFRLPDGFHFDVRHDANRAFFVRNESGQALKFQRYTNIDAHGYIRGGG